MCGLAGLIWRDLDRPAAGDLIRAMTGIMAHRGPDDEGHWTCGPVALGHRRLSILDLSSAGHQPMQSADGRFVVVYNGEIYNYLELRAELEKGGQTFFSNSDTEVLIESYRKWGRECVERFNGMWAFALYDTETGEIFFSRDRFGIKPLYYILRPDCLAFASEIKAILAALPDERRVSEAIIHHFLPSGALDDGPGTFLAGVRQLPPAHSALYKVRSGDFRVWRFWDLDREAFQARWLVGDPVEVMWDLLESAVSLHMRSDVPVGTCLSGGVDSSSIVCLMSRLGPEPVHTFSGLYPDPECDESRYIEAVNTHANTIPCPVHPEPDGDLLADLSRITWHQDAPSAGPGLYTQYHVMSRASQEVKVILDGQGGDELFAGYLPYFLPHFRDLLEERSLSGYWEAMYLIGAVTRHWGYQWGKTIASQHGLSRIARRLRLPRLGAPLKKTASPAPLFFHESLLDRVDGYEIELDLPQRLPKRLDDRLYWDLVQTCIPALLRYEDRNSMAFSIEARVPLLDYRIVEFALALDSKYKINRSWTKWVLRQAAARAVPPQVAWRRSKMGYPTPFSRWLRQDKDRGQIREVILSRSFRERELVPEETIRYYWNRHQAGQDWSWLLYRYLTLEIWFRQYIDGWRPDPVTPAISV